jgi:hypothetical protein
MVKTNKDPGKKKRRCWRVVTDGRESSEFPTGAKHVGSSSLLVNGAEIPLCYRQLCDWRVLEASLRETLAHQRVPLKKPHQK